MIQSRVAQRYAKAVMEIAKEQKDLDRVIEDFRTLRGAIKGSHELRSFLISPVIDERTKEKILRSIFEGKISDTTARFVSLMTAKGRAAELPAIIDAFQTLLDRERNIVPATITTAVEMTAEQKGRLEEQIAQLSGRNVRAEYRVDPALIGGFSARFEDTMIDASVRHQLERMRESLLAGSIN
jgi:F-type H+-transporting ATPase subunit delta